MRKRTDDASDAARLEQSNALLLAISRVQEHLEAQGFLYQAPVSAEEFIKHIRITSC